MIRSRDFRLLSVQAVAFTPGTEDFGSARVLASIIPSFADRYDGEIESLPVQFRREGTGVEIRIPSPSPSLSLTSRDRRWKYEASAKRCDSFWFAQSEDDGRANLRDVCRLCGEPLLDYPVGPQQIGRLALVVKRWMPAAHAAKALAEQFCRPQLVDESNEFAPLRHSRKFQVHNLKRYESPIGVAVNSWVRCRSDDVAGESAVSVEHDINTLDEEASRTAFREEEVKRFFDWVPDEMDRVLDLYFPSEG